MVLEGSGYGVGVREQRLWCWRVTLMVSENNGPHLSDNDGSHWERDETAV
jgi:hypothetical protein